MNRSKGMNHKLGNIRPQPTTLHIRNVPPHLKAQFKAWCAKRDYTMEGCVCALLRKTLNEDKPVPGAKRTRRMGN